MEEVAFSEIRCVLFDAVGTLFAPDPPVVLAYQAAGRAAGIDLAAEVIRERFGRAYSTQFDGRASPTSEALERARWRSVVAEVFAESAEPDRLLEQLWNHFAAPQSWRLAEDAQVCLATLAARGYEIAIASNFDGRLRAICAGHSLPVADDLVFVSSEVGYSKPHPQFFAAVAQRLGRQPRELLLIGDSPQHDVAGALAAGWAACLLDRDSLNNPLPHLVATLDDLLTFLPGRPAP